MGFVSTPAIWFGGSLFIAAVLLAGYLTPGYSHFQQSISELGALKAPYGWLVRWVGFVPLGLSFVIFACQSGGLFSNLMPAGLFLTTGLAVLIAGIFPTDPDNRRDTPSGRIHASAVIALLLLLSLGPFTFSISALYRTPPAEWFPGFSFLMGMVALGFLAAMPGGDKPELAARHQRILLLVHFLWWFVFSVVLAAHPEAS